MTNAPTIHRRKTLGTQPGVAGVLPALCGARVVTRSETTLKLDQVTCRRCLQMMRLGL